MSVAQKEKKNTEKKSSLEAALSTLEDLRLPARFGTTPDPACFFEIIMISKTATKKKEKKRNTFHLGCFRSLFDYIMNSNAQTPILLLSTVLVPIELRKSGCLMQPRTEYTHSVAKRPSSLLHVMQGICPPRRTTRHPIVFLDICVFHISRCIAVWDKRPGPIGEEGSFDTQTPLLWEVEMRVTRKERPKARARRELKSHSFQAPGSPHGQVVHTPRRTTPSASATPYLSVLDFGHAAWHHYDLSS